MKRVLGAALPALLLLAACGDDSASDAAAPAATSAPASSDNGATDDGGGTPATGEPIRLGAVSSLSGPAPFPEAGPAAQAVFDRYNEQGGLDGRPIELLVEDDASDAAQAAAGARKLVEEEGVVAMVASASLLSCAANAQYLSSQGIASLVAVGVDPVCFASDDMAPVNTGPYFSVDITLTYLSETLGLDNVCFLTINRPELLPAYQQAVGAWEEATGNTLTELVVAELQDDPNIGLTRLRSAGCDAVSFGLIEPLYVSYLQAADAGGFRDDYQIMMLTSGYSATLAEALGPAGNGIPANSEFEPFTGDCECLADFKELMAENDIALTSFATAGYLAANIAIQALESIEGDVTRESVAEAFRNVAYETELLGEPFTWGNQPNRSSKIVELQDGGWVEVAEDWLTFPPDA